MATVTNNDEMKAQLANAQKKLDLVKTYGKAFVKSRKGEIKLSINDVNKLNDLIELMFGTRLSNISENIFKTFNDKPRNWNSELVIKDPDGSVFKIYSNVPEYKLDEILKA